MSNDEKHHKTKLERIGGKSAVKMLLNSLYDELLESPELEPFFRYAPIETIKTHQSVLFPLLLGSVENKPTSNKTIDYMLASHSRLFRDFGLNEAHFDVLVVCLLHTLKSFDVDQDLINEIVADLRPLRNIFKYGAEIAAKEKEMEADQMKLLPVCSASSIGTDTKVILPNSPLSNNDEIPSWLEIEMRKVTRKKNLREWTSNLSDRCSSTGDVQLADVMMDVSIIQLESYLSNFIRLAFLPDANKDDATKFIKILRYPRGSKNDPLSRPLYDRLVKQFIQTCDDMNIPIDDTKVLAEKLRSHRKSFPKIQQLPSNGADYPLDQKLYDDQDVVDDTEHLMDSFSILQHDSSTESGRCTSKTRRPSKTSHSMGNLDPVSLASTLSPAPNPKNAIIKWFGMRKASMNMTVNDGLTL